MVNKDKNINDNIEYELIRTDSETLTYLYYRKMGNKIGSKLSPLGRERRIKRLDDEIAKEYKLYTNI